MTAAEVIRVARVREVVRAARTVTYVELVPSARVRWVLRVVYTAALAPFTLGNGGDGQDT